MSYRFIPRSRGAAVTKTEGSLELIGTLQCSLSVHDIPRMMADGIRTIIEYDTSGYFLTIPSEERAAYWEWAKSNVVLETQQVYLGDYPQGFVLVPYACIDHAGEQIIVFVRYH